MTQRVSNLRLMALILAIGAGLLLEAKAADSPDLAKHECLDKAVHG